MKIRGNTVGTPLDPKKAVLKCDGLNKDEKAQARKNIGAASIDDAISPTIGVSATSYGYQLTITDKDGTRTVDVFHGDSIKGDTGLSMLTAPKLSGAGVTVQRVYIGELQCPENYVPKVGDLVLYNDGYLGYIHYIDNEHEGGIDVALFTPEIVLRGPQGEQGIQGIQGPKGDPATTDGCLRYDIEQALDAADKVTALRNLGLDEVENNYVRYDKAQSLTPAQKTQARTNIGAISESDLQYAIEGIRGADLLIVTVERDTASHSALDIFAHVQNGGSAVLVDGYEIYTLAGCADDDYATFEHWSADYVRFQWIVWDDYSAELSEKYFITSDDVPSGGGGSSPLFVTINDQGDTASHNALQIYEHVQHGGTAVLYDGAWLYNLRGCTPDWASFELVTDDCFTELYIVYNDGSISSATFENLHEGTLSNYIYGWFEAEPGQALVVESVDDEGRAIQWKYVDLPSGGGGSSVLVANFEDYEDGTIYCRNHTALEIDSALYNGIPVMATVSDPNGDNVSTELCWLRDRYSVFVGDHYADSGWCHNIGETIYYKDGNPNNKTPGNELWHEF